MEKTATFNFACGLMKEDELALAGIEDYKNPLLTWVKLVFTDDQSNKNDQGIKQEEFTNLIKSMTWMPIKASYNAESGLGGHDEAVQIGVIKTGEQLDNKIVTIGALYNDENIEIVDFIKNQFTEDSQVNFSWEVRYKTSDTDEAGTEWLKEVTTKAITAVEHPAYDGRTPLLSISSIDFLKAVEEELIARGEKL